MKPWTPSEMERRNIAVLVDLAFKTGAMRDEATASIMSRLKTDALRGLPPIDPKKEGGAT